LDASTGTENSYLIFSSSDIPTEKVVTKKKQESQYIPESRIYGVSNKRSG
jgi:hypothetical protein